MADNIPEDIRRDLEKACSLHQRASADYHKCLEFNQLMSTLLGKLEDADCNRAADKVMTILLDCNPREGAHCEKSAMVADKITKLTQS